MLKNDNEIAEATIQFRTTRAFKAALELEASKRVMSCSKLLQRAFWAYIEDDLNDQGSLLDK